MRHGAIYSLWMGRYPERSSDDVRAWPLTPTWRERARRWAVPAGVVLLAAAAIAWAVFR